MSRFTLPFQRAEDNNGHPLSGAKLYFYESETNTPLDTFSDVLRTIANTNPVIADSSGQFDDIYLQNLSYRVDLQDSNSVSQPNYPADDITSSSSVGLIASSIVLDIATMRTGLVVDGSEIILQQHTTLNDGGGGNFIGITGAAAGTYADDNAFIIVPTGGDGSSAWMRQCSSDLDLRQAGIIGNDSASGNASILACINFLVNYRFTKGTITIPTLGITGGFEDVVYINATVELPRGIQLRGETDQSQIVADYTAGHTFKSATYRGLTADVTVFPAIVWGGEVIANVFAPHTADAISTSNNRAKIVTMSNLLIGDINPDSVINAGIVCVASVAGKVWSFDLDHVQINGFYLNLGDFGVFNDQFSMTKCKIRAGSAVNADLAKVMLGYGDTVNNNGDINVIEHVPFQNTASRGDFDVAMVNRTSAVIRNCINGHFRMRECTRVSFKELKQEAGTFDLAVGSASFEDCEFSGHADNVTPTGRLTLLLQDSRLGVLTVPKASSVYSITNSTVQRRWTSFAGGAHSNPDVSLVGNVTLRTKDFFASIGSRRNNVYYAPLVADSAGVTFPSWQNNAHFLARDGVVNGYGKVEFDGLITNDVGDLAVSQWNSASFSWSCATTTNASFNDGWKAAAGTYYYKFEVLMSADPVIGISHGTEKSATVALTDSGIKITYNGINNDGAGTLENCIVRIWRGTSAGSYTRVIDIPVISASDFIDHGLKIGNIPWKTITAQPADPVITIKGIRDFREFRNTQSCCHVVGGFLWTKWGAELVMSEKGVALKAGSTFTNTNTSIFDPLAEGKKVVIVKDGMWYGPLRVSSVATIVDNILVTSTGNVYKYTVAGTLGATEPTHTSGSALDGTATALFITNTNVCKYVVK